MRPDRMEMKVLRDIPNWMLYQICMAGGRRLPMRPLIAQPRSTPDGRCIICRKDDGDSRWRLTNKGWVHIKCADAAEKAGQLPQKGNLQPNEYLYYFGSWAENSPFHQCRACRKTMYAPLDIVSHSRTMMGGLTCLGWIANAVTKLPKGKCVCCAATSKTRLHGIYFCSVRCVERWRYEPQEFPLWKVALEAAGFPKIVPAWSSR